MAMNNPPHPGRLIRDACLEPLGLTVTKAAAVLGVARKNLSAILNAKAAISPEMAIRLEKAFGSTAETWLKMQTAYNLAQTRQHEEKIKVTRYVPDAPA